MTRVHVLRHGIAMDRDDPGCPADGERRLTARGVRRVRAAATGLDALGARPRFILSSPWERALETARIVARVLPADVRVTDALLPDEPPERLAGALADAGRDEVLCVGHAPHVDALVAWLIEAPGPVTRLGKCGLATVEWRGVEPGGAVLVRVARPRDLRRLGRSRKR